MSEQRVRISEDDHGPRTTYQDIAIGEVLGEMDWVVTDEMIAKQCAMAADFHTWYFVDSPWGGRIAPPQVSYRPPRWLLSRTYNVRGLFYKWEMENVRPIRSGEPLHITAKIVDKYVKNEREFVVYEAEATGAGGEPVFRTRRTHVLDVVERSAPRAGKGVDSGIKAERI